MACLTRFTVGRFVIGVMAASLLFFNGNVYAQQNPMYDHVHYMVPDPGKAAAWYAQYMGGTLKAGNNPVVEYGKTVLRFSPLPMAIATEGSVIDHMGFSFPDLESKLAELKNAGVKITVPLREAPGIFKLAFVEDPWGGKIELVQDQDSLGFHHVHLRGPEPESMLTWIAETFGGERVKMKGRIDGVKQGEVVILAMKSEKATDPSLNHIIDHLGYGVTNLDETLKALREKGVKVTQEPQGQKVKWAFVESPLGVRVELIQWK